MGRHSKYHDEEDRYDDQRDLRTESLLRTTRPRPLQMAYANPGEFSQPRLDRRLEYPNGTSVVHPGGSKWSAKQDSDTVPRTWTKRDFHNDLKHRQRYDVGWTGCSCCSDRDTHRAASAAKQLHQEMIHSELEDGRYEDLDMLERAVRWSKEDKLPAEVEDEYAWTLHNRDRDAVDHMLGRAAVKYERTRDRRFQKEWTMLPARRYSSSQHSRAPSEWEVL